MPARTELLHDPSAAAALLRAGQLVALPTETVYGLGAAATQERAVAQVFEAKQRPEFDPLIAHVLDAAQAEELVEWCKTADQLAEAFWPGPLTLVLPRRADCRVSLLASSGLASLAVRAPQHPLIRAVIEELKEPVVAPSANLFGRLSPSTAQHVLDQLDGRIAAVLDGGPCRIGLESTVVLVPQAPSAPLLLLRPGAITPAQLEAATGCPVLLPQATTIDHRLAPGMLPSHYAPRQPLTLKALAQPWPSPLVGGVLAFHHAPPDAQVSRVLSPTGSLTEAAANLFPYLHELEASGVTELQAELVPEEGIGLAINDRLRRAAGLGKTAR